jgi:capsular polysaccharide biosynthesis protein
MHLRQPLRTRSASRFARVLPQASRLRSVASFDDVVEAETVPVDLPREPAPRPSSRTVQAASHRVFTTMENPAAAYPLRVAIVPHGRLVTGSGLVLTRDGALVRETLWDDEHLAREFARPRVLSSPSRLAGRHVSLMSLWADGFFHWIFNCLPRLAVLRASGVEYDSLIVPRNLRRFHRETLALLGIDEAKLTPYAGEHVEAEELVWVAPLSPLNSPTTFLIRWLRDALGGEPAAGREQSRLLYVSRRGGTRKAANEQELFAALEPLGFEFVLPEDHAFADQIRLFAQAKALVGPHGSQFVNGIFSRRLSVLECFQPAHVNYLVYNHLCAAGHDHWHLLCPPVRGAWRQPRRFDDMAVPIPDVIRTMERMLG